MRLNLLLIRSLVEGLTMNDACKISRDPSGVSDDTWDEATGTYIPPANDRISVYVGPCSVYPIGSTPQEDDEGGQELAVVRYWLGIPMEAEVLSLPEDLVEITAVDSLQGDPMLLDRSFSIESQEYATLASTRRFVMKLMQVVP